MPIPEAKEFYKISRKKNSLNKRNKYHFFKVNSITNSNYSGSKNPTEVSENNVSSQNSNNQTNKFDLNSRIKTIEEKKSTSSYSLPFINNNIISQNNNLENFNKNFIETKIKIRRKIHSSDKALPITTEEKLNKIYKRKKS